MIQSFLSYSILISLMLFCSFKYKETCHTNKINLLNPLILFIFIIYVVFCAIRFNVGMDYMTYYNEFLECRRYTTYESLLNKEPGWAYITWYLSTNHYHYTIYFGIISAIQFIFILKAFGNRAYLLPSLIISFFIGGYFLDFQNVLRQNIVMAIFLYIVMRHRNIRILYLIIIVCMCMLIHKSSFIMLLLYPLYKFKFNIIKHNTLLMFIFSLCVLIGFTLDLFSKLASSPVVLLTIADSEYNSYASENYLNMGSKAIGIGFMLRVVVDGIIIGSCKKVCKYFKDADYAIYFQIFYIGTCLHYLFPTSMIIGRPILYLTLFTLPILSFYIYYSLHTISKKTTLSNFTNIFALSAILLLFVFNYFINPQGYMSEFHFYWENWQNF